MTIDHEMLKMNVLQLIEENERLKAALAWAGQVRPRKNPVSGGAIVHMTWDEFNAMREATGLKRVRT